MKKIIGLLSMIILSCSPSQKPGDKVFGKSDIGVYSLVEPITINELELMKLEAVEFKKKRNELETIKPYMLKTHLITEDQFYKRSTGSVGTVISIQKGFYNPDYRKVSYFIELKFDEDITMIREVDGLYDPGDNNLFKIKKSKRYVSESDFNLSYDTLFESKYK